jgi:membrane associated rhomboid family serine protease
MREYRTPNPTGVLIVIFVNVLVFIATSLKSDLIYDLHLVPADFTSEPWTIATSFFVHADLWHILGNMVTLYFFGTYLTTLVGEKKFLAIYFLGGLLGGVFYMVVALYAPWGEPDIGVIGASGAVFAIGGALAVLRPNLKVLLFFVIPMPLWVAVIGGFALLTLISIYAGLSIAWEAHLGGLVVGLIAGFLFSRRKRERDRYLL